MRFKSVLIIGHKQTDLVQSTIIHLQLLLDKLGLTYFLEDELVDAHLQPDLVISVGGDGCFLAAAQWAWQLDIPIIGINCGRLGFLGDLLPQQLPQLSEIITQGMIEQRTVLELNQRIAINEVLIAGDCLGVLATLQVEVNHLPLCTYQADGLIVSTATGSTGHALSCGGPILEPTSEQVILAPLASHKLSSRPLVVTPKAGIKIKMLGKQNGSVVLDGRHYAANQSEINITTVERKLKLLHPADYSFFAILRSKLEWEN